MPFCLLQFRLNEILNVCDSYSQNEKKLWILVAEDIMHELERSEDPLDASVIDSYRQRIKSLESNSESFSTKSTLEKADNEDEFVTVESTHELRYRGTSGELSKNERIDRNLIRQDEIVGQMTELSKMLRDQAESAHLVLAQDIKKISSIEASVSLNIDRLSKQTKTLKARISWLPNCSQLFAVIAVVVAFIWVVLLMKLFKKKPI
ncbi:hypothetical protein ACOME3_006705 [Neoechinorhynchus agilis]